MDKQVRTVRHDMNNQLQIIYGLLSQERYDEAKAFLKEYSISLEKQRNIFTRMIRYSIRLLIIRLNMPRVKI